MDQEGEYLGIPTGIHQGTPFQKFNNYIESNLGKKTTITINKELGKANCLSLYIICLTKIG